jgi:hypothetical protein
MLKFFYTQVSGISPIPIVNLYLQNIDNLLLSAVADCSILDTCSDLTLVSFSLISKLQAKLISGKSRIPFKGLSRQIEGIPYRVKVSFDGEKYFNALVIAVADCELNGETIVGRNILNRYVINLDGRNRFFTIDL